MDTFNVDYRPMGRFEEFLNSQGDLDLQPASNAGGRPLDVQSFKCPFVGCTAAPYNSADLLRHHQKEKHTVGRRYLCHVDRCPRGINGEGFVRMYQLIKHLTSKVHNMDKNDAKLEAAKYNKPKGGQ